MYQMKPHLCAVILSILFIPVNCRFVPSLCLPGALWAYSC
jgi:hypothetical protein